MRKGTVIQVFGRFFAGQMDMFMERWYKVYHDFAGSPFKVTGVSPFSIMGAPDPSLQKYTECARTNTRVKADIWKNFEDICEKAHCDYFVFDNSSALIGLTQINGQFYSLMGGEGTDFMDDYYNNNEAIKRGYIRPVNEGLSERLKYQYDLFIDAILRHYDPEHIILIRSHIPRFRSDNGRVAKTKHSAKARAFLETLDDYFAKRVGCPALYTPLHYFETKDCNGNSPFSGGQEDLRVALERAVIMEIEKSSPQCGIVSNPFFPRIRNDVLKSHAASFFGLERDDALMKTLDTLTPYWKGTETIADYIADGQGDFDLIASYFKYVDYSADDIVALYFLYGQIENKNVFTDIAKAIISNKQSIVYLNTENLFSRNMELLRGYEYNCIDMSDIEYEERVVVRLDARHYIVVTNEGIRMVDLVSPKAWDYKRFIEDNYVCKLSDLDDALESWETYFERGRRKCNTPFSLCFDKYGDFIETLYYLDHEDILSNERYVIKLNDQKVSTIGYEPMVDVTFLFDEQTRIGNINSGLSDQIHYFTYIYNTCITNGLSYYLNDLQYDISNHFNGMELFRLLDTGKHKRFFSNIFSNKLRLRMRNMHGSAPFPIHSNSLWRVLGLVEAYLVVWCPRHIKNHERTMTNVRTTPILYVSDIDSLCDFSTNKIPTKILFTCMQSHHMYGVMDKRYWENTFTFPVIKDSDERNMRTAESLRTQDSIVLHIRRTDYMTGNKKYNEGYQLDKGCVNYIWTDAEFSRYLNKHLYVFSDDIQWVKKHYDDLGLGCAGTNITYVDWNHHYYSIYDMHLMSLAKVILLTLGGFARTAAYISKHVEYVVTASSNSVKIEWKREATP